MVSDSKPLILLKVVRNWVTLPLSISKPKDGGPSFSPFLWLLKKTSFITNLGQFMPEMRNWKEMLFLKVECTEQLHHMVHGLTLSLLGSCLLTLTSLCPSDKRDHSVHILRPASGYFWLSFRRKLALSLQRLLCRAFLWKKRQGIGVGQMPEVRGWGPQCPRTGPQEQVHLALIPASLALTANSPSKTSCVLT